MGQGAFAPDDLMKQQRGPAVRGPFSLALEEEDQDAGAS